MSPVTPTPDCANPFIEHPADHRPWLGGDQYFFKFPNGYGASVIRNSSATPVAEDVLGWLDEREVAAYLRQIAELPEEAS